MSADKPLKVILFGATGMVGASLLGELLKDDSVTAVLAVGRSACGVEHPKLKELVLGDLFDIGVAVDKLTGYDGCLYALGRSSVGLNEQQYTRITYELSVAVGQALLKANPGMGIAFVSGEGTDATEQGRVMWARVKGRAENALLGLGFSPAVMIRLGVLVPPPGFRSKTPWIQWTYTLLRPFIPVLMALMPGMINTPGTLSRAMLKALRGQAPKAVLESKDIRALGSA